VIFFKDIVELLLVQNSNLAIGYRNGARRPGPSIDEFKFSEKIPRVKNREDGFIAPFRCFCNLDAAGKKEVQTPAAALILEDRFPFAGIDKTGALQNLPECVLACRFEKNIKANAIE
jgi:hypothetical protein